MAYEIIGWKNKGETGAKPINRDNLRHMDNGILNLDTYKAEIIPLLTVSDTAPVECERGDLYYNTTTELIYVATQPDTWSEEGTTPSTFNLYVDLSSSKLYYYDGTNFNSYGSGGGGETLPVGTELDFDGVSQDIPTGWESVTNPDSYSTSEVKTNMTWVDGKPVYRKVIQYNKTTNGQVDLSLSSYGITNVENIWLNQNSFIKTNDNEWKAVNTYESDSYFTFCTFSSANSFRLSSNSSYARGLWNLIIEYTKTTD